jgi:glycosyltransferase involved in cell wall biosynthesis
VDLLHKSPSIRDHVVVIDSATDDDLKYLYKSCLFTVFPTRAEGWGLPVAESLVFGKACIASRVDSIPEVGRTLCEYIDVDDTDAWYVAIERLIFDEDSRRRFEERIALEFKPTPWSATADDLLSAVLNSDGDGL